MRDKEEGDGKGSGVERVCAIKAARLQYVKSHPTVPHEPPLVNRPANGRGRLDVTWRQGQERNV